MSDLHYLRLGAGDIAQLDFHLRFFDAYLDMANARGLLPVGELAIFYSSVESQLANMRALHGSAERHLAPIIDAAVAKER